MEEKETKKKTSPAKASAKNTKTKSTATKTTTRKKTTSTNSTSGKKTTTKKATTTASKKSSTTRKTSKKATTEPAKKQVEKESSILEKNIEKNEPSKEEKDILLEKTIIFDGIQSKNLNDVVNKLEEDKVVLNDKVIKRSKVRKVIIIILAIAMVVVGIATIKYIVDEVATINKNKETLNSNIFNKASENYSSEDEIEESKNSSLITDIAYDNIETITLSEFEKKALQKEDMIVLIASTTCYSSITFEPVINEVFKELDKTIYRLNISSMPEDDVTKFRTYYAFEATPTMFIIKDGIVTADARGTMTEENLKRWLDENL